MENLNKENFFNEMAKKYPKALGQFYIWLNNYKKNVNWTSLFNLNYNEDGLPKLEHLPYEMQLGIFMRYASDTFEEDNIEVPEMKQLFETVLIASTTLLGLYKNEKN